MRLKVFLVLVLGVAIASALSLYAANKAEDYVENARQAQRNGDFKAASDILTKAIKSGVSAAEVFLGRGLAYEKMGMNQEAITDYTKAIQIDPNLETAFNNRGSIYYRRGDFVRSIKDFSRAIELNPFYSIAYYNRGNAYQGAGEFEKAVEDFTRAIELDPNDPDSFKIEAGRFYKNRIPTEPFKILIERYSLIQTTFWRFTIAVTPD